MALVIFICSRGNFFCAWKWFTVQCNVIEFMMLLCITMSRYAPSHEKFEVTTAYALNLSGNSPQSFLNAELCHRRYSGNLSCVLTVAFSIFHAHVFFNSSRKFGLPQRSH